MNTRTLRISTGTSKGAETYGYTIVRLHDMQTGKRYRCMGGGYDMIGTVFAEWLQDQYQDELKAIQDQAHAVYVKSGDTWDRTTNDAGLYGMTASYTAKLTSCTITLDGGCGLSSMERIAKTIGLSVRAEISPRGRTVGFIVTDERAK